MIAAMGDGVAGRARRPLVSVLVDRGLFGSEDEARRWIMAGRIMVAGQRVDKAGASVFLDADIDVKNRPRYASRGGYKLAAALDHFGIGPQGRVALDCGASTGGFTDCLLQRGASLVYAVDAGHGQLVGRLRIDPRVRNLERTNLAELSPEMLQPRPTLITLDLSYLSLTQALPISAPLLCSGGEALALLKPLFEVQDLNARRTGRIAESDAIVASVSRVLDAAEGAGYATRGVAKLALQPRHGVSELFLYLERGAGTSRPFDRDALPAIVSSPGIGPTTVAE